jgi:hypothetical protein
MDQNGCEPAGRNTRSWIDASSVDSMVRFAVKLKPPPRRGGGAGGARKAEREEKQWP